MVDVVVSPGPRQTGNGLFFSLVDSEVGPGPGPGPDADSIGLVRLITAWRPLEF